jgi:flavin reductase (DIM6/NTAB) family NADH-FMN oxidoreductase RutF
MDGALTPEPTAGVSAQSFREMFSGVAAPVSIVTAECDGRFHATTVTAFCSLSIDPPLMLVALARTSDMLGFVDRSRRFAVNILAAGQEQTALACAQKGTEKLSVVPWVERWGLPWFEASAGWLGCEVQDLLDGGDHVIVVGLVVDCEITTRTPLLYHGRDFHIPQAIAAPAVGA